jgi:hypothetical protein
VDRSLSCHVLAEAWAPQAGVADCIANLSRVGEARAAVDVAHDPFRAEATLMLLVGVSSRSFETLQDVM